MLHILASGERAALCLRSDQAQVGETTSARHRTIPHRTAEEEDYVIR